MACFGAKKDLIGRAGEDLRIKRELRARRHNAGSFPGLNACESA
jgi:hypothetical protein